MTEKKISSVQVQAINESFHSFHDRRYFIVTTSSKIRLPVTMQGM